MVNNNFLNVHDVILIFTVIEIPFLCALLKLSPARNEQPRNLLIFFFIFVAGTLIATLITWNSYLQTLPIADSALIPLMLSCCLLLQGPTLYCYLRSLSKDIPLFEIRNLIHVLPAIIVCLVILVFNINVHDWHPDTWSSLPAYSRGALKFIHAVIKCAPLFYVLACFYLEYKLRQQLKEMAIEASNNDLLWMYIVLGGFFIHWFWSFVAYFLSDYVNDDVNDFLGIVNNYYTVILVNILFAYGLSSTRRSLNLTLEDAHKANDLTRVDEKITAVEHAMNSQKLYLDSQINLERFAEQIHLKPREVSAILSSHFQSNFFEFINRYRVEEAKRLLLSPDCKKDTIQEIIFKAGFNSQSAFHRFFKRLVGMTPSEYRNQHEQTNLP